jgi:hypothetical protein
MQKILSFNLLYHQRSFGTSTIQIKLFIIYLILLSKAYSSVKTNKMLFVFKTKRNELGSNWINKGFNVFLDYRFKVLYSYLFSLLLIVGTIP